MVPFSRTREEGSSEGETNNEVTVGNPARRQQTPAASVLGISIRTLRDKLNEYAADGVPVPPRSGEPRAAA